MAMAAVDNGVNVQALLDARDALKGSPEATQFTWRASCKWVNGTHSQATVKGFFGLGEEQSHKTETTLRGRPSRDLRVGGQRDHADRVRARRAGELPHRGHRGGCAEPRVQLRSVESKLEGKMDIRGILGMDSDVRNGFSDIKVTFNIDADASKQDIEAIVAQSQKRSAVYDAHHEPGERHRRSGLEPSSSSRRSSSGPVTPGSRPAGFSPSARSTTSCSSVGT